MPTYQKLQIVFVSPDGTERDGPAFECDPTRTTPRREFRHEQWDVPTCLTHFRAALQAEDDEAARVCMQAMDRLNCWHEAFESLLAAGGVAGTAVLRFWTTYGFHIADSMQADPILARVLKTLLPPYSGLGLTLYRGEDMGRHQGRTYGISWT